MTNAAASSEDTAVRHRDALLAFFEEVSDMATNGLTQPTPYLLQKLTELRGYIATKAPCADRATFPAELFITRVNWVADPNLRGLFQEYVDGGVIDPNGGLVTANEGNTGVLPLELAVITGSLDALQAYLEVGAEPLKVPSRDWTSSPDAGTKPGQAIADIYQLIDARSPVHQRAEPMKALVTEHLMRNRVESTRAEAPAGSARASPRRAL